MSKLKKLASVMLALVMCFGLTVTAFAADTYTITVNNSTEGYTYAAYQIFSGDYDSSSGVLSNIEWSTDNITTSIDVNGTAVSIYTALAAIKDDNGNYPFTDTNGNALTSASDVAVVLATYSNDNAVLQDFADVIADYITGTAAGTSTGDYDTTGSDPVFKGTYTISDLAAGYYLVKNTSVPTSAGSEGVYTRYILAQTTANGASESPKSSVPSIDKDLSDVDANIGDTITYYLTATLPSTYDDYSTYKLIFHDTLSKGLTYDTGSVKVYVFTNGNYGYDQVLTNGTLVSASDYTVSSLTTESDGGHSFSVTLTDTKTLTADSDGSTISTSSSSLIVVTFEADLNSDAVIGGAGNPNEVYLEYSNNPNSGGSGDTGTTPEDKVVTWTYELDVTKVDGSDGTTPLKDAKFKLYRESDGYYAIVDLTTNKITGWSATKDGGTELTSDDSGIFTVIGLDVGTYYLTETEAPSGYNKLTTDTKLVIAATYTKTDSGTPTNDDVTLNTLTISVDSGTAANGTTSTGIVKATVKNNKGVAMPSTGGIGTTIFYVVGGVLVVGAVVLLITRKRMKDDQ
ncbi:MAG: SpaH/EbpB family LPXTG-anchored major pilin [Clostridiales bacterium]|nr:SpaH/EbpB family LPXTG-anchored major pilin [Clostridiales bacterium]